MVISLVSVTKYRFDDKNNKNLKQIICHFTQDYLIVIS